MNLGNSYLLLPIFSTDSALGQSQVVTLVAPYTPTKTGLFIFVIIDLKERFLERKPTDYVI